MANRRVSLKGKGADLFFGGPPPAEIIDDLTPPSPPTEAPSDVPTDSREPEIVLPLPPAEPDTSSAKPGKKPRNHGTVVPRYHDTIIETLRKAVRVPGKEAATYRLTQDEKVSVADIIYTYKRQGIRTSEIEISRIALNFILTDYEENGDESVLARVLKALHE